MLPVFKLYDIKEITLFKYIPIFQDILDEEKVFSA